MIIPSLIRTLLEENSVTITGLGTFSVKKVPAQIKDEVIFPPQNIIEFEYSKDAESADFVDKLSKWEQTGTDEAQAEISEWLGLLEKGLEHNKTIFFDDFGTFSKDFLGKMVFQSVLNSQLNIENEGFEPILVPPVIKEEENQRNIYTPEPVKDKRIILTKKKKKKRDMPWFIFTIFIAGITLSALFLKDKIQNMYQTVFAKEEVNTVMKDSNNEDVANIIELPEEEPDEPDALGYAGENVQTNSFSENSAPQKSENKENQKVTLPKTSDIYQPYQKGKYYVIAGSFTNEADGLRHIKQQKLEKYHAKLIVHPDSPRVRVVIGVFDNESVAAEFAAQIDKNYWVLK